MKPRLLLAVVTAMLILVVNVGAPAHGHSLVNPDFSDDLNGWTVSESGGSAARGTVSVIDGQALILEGDSFLVTLQQTFTVSAFPSTLSFDISLDPGFDQTDDFIPDAFEASLLTNDSASVVPSWKPAATSFFNLQEDGTAHLGSDTTFDGTTVTVDISSITRGSEVTFVLDFIGGDADVDGGVRIDSVVTRDLEPEEVPVDIKATSCPNPLNSNRGGTLPAAILGTAGLDVAQIDVTSVRLEGVSPLGSSLEDVAVPFVPFTGRAEALDCTEDGPDGFLDLTLKFDNRQVVAALDPVSDGETRVLTLTGNLLAEFGGRPIVGEDVVVVVK